MLHYYKSNSLKSLAESFSNVLESDSLNPLKAPWIVVQNNEIKEWLSLYYANQKGIAANFRFIFPSEFLWTLYRLHRKDIPQNLPGDLSAMHWALFQLFTDQPDKLQLIPSFSSEIEDPKKLFQFCAQLADVFDQYQVYRPEMIESWLKDEMKSRHKDEKWQAQIWKTLNDVWASNPEINNIPRRSEAFTHLLDLIENDKAYLNQLPEHLYVFGLSQASNPFLEIITSLSVNKQVHFFAGNENVVEVNEASKALFETWSKPKKQQQDLIQELIKRKDISYKPLQINASKNFIEVKIHSGHNKRREVETLKDSVLRFLDSNKNSRADDVLILVPDAEAYAGTLETTFSNNDGEPALPISGITKKSTQSASHALVQLLELFSTAFKATEVIQLMQLSPIREKFGFAETDIDLIEDWIIQNKIFFGLGDDFNAAYSWTKGLNQLLAGFAMEAEDWQVYNGLMPFGGISSSDQVQLAARFANFIHTLKAAAEKEIIPKKPQEWVSFTERLVQDFISDQHEVISQKSRLFQLLKKLKDQLSFSKASGEVSYELIKTWLINQIDSDSSSSGRFGQGITVSTYVPYRSVPYQFIAMLGMNESVFPRKSVRPTFDLIYADPKPGDRILKEDDTLLFLETLNAAQKHLHLSYEGQDQKTDSIKLPSILIQQFSEVWFEEPESEERKHALHPFNEKYFSDEKWLSYSGENSALATQILEPSESDFFIDENFKKSIEKRDEIDISELINFFCNPAKQFVQNQLDIKNYSDFTELSDRESFRLNALEKYGLGNLLLDVLIENPAENVQDFFASSAVIPEGLAGEKIYQSEKRIVNQLIALAAENAVEKERKEEVVLEIESFKLKGIISGVCGENLLSYRVGRLKSRQLIEHWLQHLLLVKAGIPITKSVFISKEGDKVNILEIESDKIQGDPLQEYLSWYLEDDSLLDSLAFFPESSKAFVEKLQHGKSESEAIKSALAKWEPGQFNFNAESEDYFNSLIWRGRNPIESDVFQQNALRFWEPFFITQKKGGK